MRLCLFEDAGQLLLEPLTHTRPTFELLCGLTTLAQKQARYFAARVGGFLVRPQLARLWQMQYPDVRVNDSAWLAAGPAVLVNGRWLPPPKVLSTKNLAADASYLAVVGSEIAYAVLSPTDLADCTALNFPNKLADWSKRLPRKNVAGRLARYLWDLLLWNAEEIEFDFAATRNFDPLHARPTELTLLGPSDHLQIDPTTRIDPFVVADTTNGPIVIERDVVVTSFSRLEGPCYLGPRTQIFGAQIRGGTSIGPNCRIGGEVAGSIILGNSNKAHAGFLGHSYLGEWVHLAAGTQTTDWRLDYETVQTWLRGELLSTGLAKVGSFLGDHAKTSLNVQLEAGTHVGIFTSIFPSGERLPMYVPSFCQVEQGRLADAGRPEQLFTTAEKVLARRGEEFSEEQRLLNQRLFEQTATARRQAIHETELRRLRRAG